MLRSSKNRTPILQERRFGGFLYWCDWGAPFGAPNRVICGAPFLLLFWSSVNISLLELRYYSFFGAPLLYSYFWALLLLLFQSSVTTPLSEHCQYPFLKAPLASFWVICRITHKNETAKATENSKNVILSRLTLVYWLENSPSTFFANEKNQIIYSCLQRIMKRTKIDYKICLVISEVSFFVGNPVYIMVHWMK